VSTAYAGWRATLGAVTGNDSEQMVGADLVVLWGVNASYSTINVMTLVKEARARGAHVVAIDPYRTPTAQQADEHLMVRPGTDAALALALAGIMVEEGWFDAEFVRDWTNGPFLVREKCSSFAWPSSSISSAMRPNGSSGACSFPVEK